MRKRLFVTGHRPDVVGGYGEEAQAHLEKVAIQSLELLQPSEVITGMALGWDTAVAHACQALGIPFVAAIPFIGQEKRWSEEAQAAYHALLVKAKYVIVVNAPPYAGWKMMARNAAMVTWGDEGLALWNEEKKEGGTAQCVKTALKAGKPMHNAWSIYTGEADKVTPIKPFDPHAHYEKVKVKRFEDSSRLER